MENIVNFIEQFFNETSDPPQDYEISPINKDHFVIDVHWATLGYVKELAERTLIALEDKYDFSFDYRLESNNHKGYSINFYSF